MLGVVCDECDNRVEWDGNNETANGGEIVFVCPSCGATGAIRTGEGTGEIRLAGAVRLRQSLSGAQTIEVDMR
jgi:hypothetical protein